MNSFKNSLKKRLRQCIKKTPWIFQDYLHHLQKFHRLPNVRNPVTFNEKLFYRKHIEKDYLQYSKLADKFLVRNYVARTIGTDFLIPLEHETSDPVTLLSLSNWKNIVIKPNHGSGMVEILSDTPDSRVKGMIIKRCREWLKKDFSVEAGERHYHYILPRILVEKRIGTGPELPADYKFHIFNQGEGKFEYVLQLIYNRSCDNDQLSMSFYVNNLTEVHHQIRAEHHPDIGSKTTLLDQALELSTKLASGFDYVRVDWYIDNQQVYFGELTFTPGAGLVTGLEKDLDKIMGQMWVLQRSPLKKPATTHRPELIIQ